MELPHLQWCLRLPKIELHAHLNGSVRPETLRQLAAAKNQPQLLAPLDALARAGGSAPLEECFTLFPIIHHLTTDHDSIATIASEVVQDFAADNVIYAELRTTPKVRDGMTKESYVQAVIDGVALGQQHVQQQQQQQQQQGQVEGSNCRDRPVSGILVKLLLSIDRREGAESAMQTVEVAKKFQQSGVVGVDLSGNPSLGTWEAWEPALIEARKAGLKVAIHGGEVKNRTQEAAAILDFHPDRLGHMCYMEGNIKERLLASRIPLELCLTSNIKSQTFSRYVDHHFRDLFAAKHPITIATDDSGMFHTTLSQELAIAMGTFGLTEANMLQLVYEAVGYTFASNEEKTELQQCLDAFRSQ